TEPDNRRLGSAIHCVQGTMGTSSIYLTVFPTNRPLRLTPTDVSQFVRLEQCERFLRFRLVERAGQNEAFGKDKRFAMLGVSWYQSPEDAQAYIAKNSLGWPHGFLGNTQAQNPGGKIIQDYHVGLPFILLIGPDGKIVARDLHRATIKKYVAEALATLP